MAETRKEMIARLSERNITVDWDTPENELGYVRPWLYDKQLEAIFNSARYSCCEASTKSGKTHGCMVWISEKAILEGGPNRNYWWVAPVSDQSDIAFRRIKEGLPKSKYEPNESRKIVKLWNGSNIWFKSADKPDSLYGEDVYGAVVDEASRCKEDSWYALRSTITATEAPVRLIGNVKGRANWMYRLSRKAQRDTTGNMHYSKITAYDAAEAGVIRYQEIEDAKAVYPELVFRELYLAEPGDDGGNPFGISHIQKCVGPISNDHPVAWGWDVAKHQDWTVGIALDNNGRVCRYHRWQDTWDNTVQKIPRLTAGVPAIIDSTGSGDQFLERLHLMGHYNFRGQLFGGWKSKQDLMVGLAVAIQNGEITFPEGRIVEELEAFEYMEVTTATSGYRILYAAPKGFHDDCVDALAMAVKLWRRAEGRTANYSPVLIEQVSHWKILG